MSVVTWKCTEFRATEIINKFEIIGKVANKEFVVNNAFTIMKSKIWMRTYMKNKYSTFLDYDAERKITFLWIVMKRRERKLKIEDAFEETIEEFKRKVNACVYQGKDENENNY